MLPFVWLLQFDYYCPWDLSTYAWRKVSHARKHYSFQKAQSFMLVGTFVSPVRRWFLPSMSKMSWCQCWSTLSFRSWCCWKGFTLICRWWVSFLWFLRLEFANGQMPNCRTLQVLSWTCFAPRSPCWWHLAGTNDHSAFSLLAFCEHLFFLWSKTHTLHSRTQLSSRIHW